MFKPFRSVTAFLSVVVFSFGLAACGEEKEKDPEPEVVTSSRESLLASTSGKNWMLTAWTTKQQGVVTDNYATMDPCDRDDIWTFYLNKNFSKTDGATKCDPNAIQMGTGTWTLQKNETELKIMEPFTPSDATVRLKQLTATTMVHDLPIIVLAPGDTIISTYTYTAQ